MGSFHRHLIDLVAFSMTAPYSVRPVARKGERHESRVDREYRRGRHDQRVGGYDDLQAHRRQRPRHLFEQADEGRGGTRPRAPHRVRGWPRGRAGGEGPSGEGPAEGGSETRGRGGDADRPGAGRRGAAAAAASRQRSAPDPRGGIAEGRGYAGGRAQLGFAGTAESDAGRGGARRAAGGRSDTVADGGIPRQYRQGIGPHPRPPGDRRRAREEHRGAQERARRAEALASPRLLFRQLPSADAPAFLAGALIARSLTEQLTEQLA